MNAHTERPARLADGKTYCACGRPWPCPHAVPDDPASATLAAAKRIADGLAFACRLPDKVPDFFACGGPAAEAYWNYFTPARITSLLAAVTAVLKRHESRVPLRILAEYGSDEAERYRYCSTCSGHPAWPCPEVRAITSALSRAAPVTPEGNP